MEEENVSMRCKTSKTLPDRVRYFRVYLTLRRWRRRRKGEWRKREWRKRLRKWEESAEEEGEN